MNTKIEQDFPHAKLEKRPRISAIWIIPILAAIAAGWLIFQTTREMGPLVTIQFEDGNGLQANQTVLKYRGVRVGTVRSVHLDKDGEHVEVQVRLDASAKGLARQGTVFWIVRPEVGAGGLRGLETVVSGPYIQAQPGNGKLQKQFVGAEQPPILAAPQGGLEITVTTPHIHMLTIGSPVYYRGIEVGSVHYFALSDDSTLINVHLLIQTNYAPLVRADSKFWNAGGIKFDLRFFKIDFNAQTFKSLIIGGIAFATPDNPGAPATAQAVFPLNDKVDDKWLKWSPVIPIVNPKSKTEDSSPSSVLLNDINPGD